MDPTLSKQELLKALSHEKLLKQKAVRATQLLQKELLQTRRELKEQTLQAQARHIQLEFLTSVSAISLKDGSLNETLQALTDVGASFLSSPLALHLVVEKDQARLAYACGGLEQSLQQGIAQGLKIQAMRTLLEESAFESCIAQIQDFKTQAWPEALKFEFLLLFPIYLEPNLHSLILFLFPDIDAVDISKLQSMETARSVVCTSLIRRQAELSLADQLQQVQAAYQELGKTKEQLVHSEKMASIGQLAAGVAHEINNPLGFVLSNIEILDDYMAAYQELIKKYKALDEVSGESNSAISVYLQEIDNYKQEEDIDFIQKDAFNVMGATKDGLIRVKDIVAGLRSFARQDAKEYDHIDINLCIQQAIRMYESQYKHQCETELALNSSKLIFGTQGQLEQVLLNMFVNAAQAMPQGGTLTVRTEDKGTHVVVEIEDTGCGISEEDQKQLFNPFFTTKAVGEGTGLGLSISYGILEKHQAEISVRSQVGEGTCFSLVFPESEYQDA